MYKLNYFLLTLFSVSFNLVSCNQSSQSSDVLDEVASDGFEQKYSIFLRKSLASASVSKSAPTVGADLLPTLQSNYIFRKYEPFSSDLFLDNLPEIQDAVDDAQFMSRTQIRNAIQASSLSSKQEILAIYDAYTSLRYIDDESLQDVLSDTKDMITASSHSSEEKEILKELVNVFDVTVKSVRDEIDANNGGGGILLNAKNRKPKPKQKPMDPCTAQVVGDAVKMGVAGGLGLAWRGCVSGQ